MFEFLDGLFNEGRVDSSRQLEEARKAQRRSPEKERLAKSLGYRNADEMIQFERQKQQRRQVQTTRAGNAVRQGMDIAGTMHPSRLLDYVTNAISTSKKGD